ncbi:MAG: branched-chain amino acid transport system ATP-binding protein [Frankiaceae bacterium]|jgi:branched-chain amino acid transport system ATP-binding protein|nr:branched-chain amino acid transport system ATP-binding protein [Frankiaceae bacterium]
MTHAIELVDVHAGYGRIEVLHGVAFAVPTGSVYALLGPNGGGKSTTLQVIAGRLKPTSGCVHIAGAHVNGAKPDALVRAGVSSIPEGRGIFPNLTVEENLRMWTYAAGLPVKQVQERAFTRFPRLMERRGQRAGTLSGGEQQMLAMSRALVADPAVLLLDEISMGLAPIIVSELYDLVRQLAEEGITILLVEQFANTALAVADFAAVMTQGRIVAVGQPQDIEEHVSAAYLGGAA